MIDYDDLTPISKSRKFKLFRLTKRAIEWARGKDNKADLGTFPTDCCEIFVYTERHGFFTLVS